MTDSTQAFVLFGYDQGVFSGIVGNEDFLNTVSYSCDGGMIRGTADHVYSSGIPTPVWRVLLSAYTI